MLKTVFNSSKTTYMIRKIIIEQCLKTPQKIYGMYNIDHEKVWLLVVSSDAILLEAMKSRRIYNYTDLILYYEELSYKAMRSTYPRNHHKHG